MDRDVWRAAHLLMKDHGEEAAVIATQRAVAMWVQGDNKKCLMWVKIATAIDDLMLAETRKPRHRLN